MDKKVSVIIPVHNAEEYIKKCLDSMVNQTIKEIQVIIVDTASVDQTENIVKEYIKQYSDFFTYLKLDNNIGMAAARNKGVGKVETPFFMFVDSDDYLEPEACEELYKTAMKSNLDIVVCDGYYYHLATDYKEEVQLYNEYSESVEKNYMVSNFRPWAKLFSTSFWRMNNLKFSENIEYEDLALIPALAAYARKIEYLRKPLYNILQRRIATSAQELYIKSIKDIFKALVIFESDIVERKKYDAFKEEIEYLYINHLLYEASIMFLKCNNPKEEIDRIVDLMKRKFPQFKWNTYYVQRQFKFRVACRLIYKRKYKIVKKYLKI